MTIFSKGIRMILILLMLPAAGFAQEPTSQKLDPNMTLKKVDADGIVWFDPRAEPFELSGFEWIKEDSVYQAPSSQSRLGDT